MDISTNNQMSVLLSREELAFLLYLLKVNTLPGMDGDLLGELDKDQQALLIIFAERALRARELARLDAENNLVLREGLLDLVGTCAYAQKSLIVHSLHGDQAVGYYAYQRTGRIVAHTRPEAPLHRFTLLLTKDELVNQVMQVEGLTDLKGGLSSEIRVSGEALSKAREAAEKGKIETAYQILISGGASEKSGHFLAEALANEHTVVVLHSFNQLLGGSFHKQAVTILNDRCTSWMMLDSQTDPDMKILRTITSTNARELVESMV